MALDRMNEDVASEKYKKHIKRNKEMEERF